MDTVPTAAPFDGLTAELTASPGLIRTLFAAHVADGHGYCRTCTVTGTHVVRMPCTLRQLAEYAVRRQRVARIAEEIGR